MENFQLYRTNLHLGGQLKWDIVIDSDKSELVVSDFHLRPISDNIPFICKTDESLLSNSHQDNVKSYYNSIKGNFYSEYLNSEFTGNWPIICNANETINSYSNIYDMGCKRMKYCKLYNKQFEFFCPLWIEQIKESLSFKFNVKIHNTDKIITSKILEFPLIDISNINNTHHKFTSYLNNYVTDAGLKNGDNNLINIQFGSNKTVVSGLNAETGLFCTKNVIGFTSDLKRIERPMMETDNMISSLFSGNNIVSKQLFNFNICFNLSDLMSNMIFKSLLGNKLTVEVEVFIDGQKLEKRDFYTNYEFINRSVKNPEDGETYNVFDYLKDHKSLSLIDKNKFCQSVCHWSLLDDNKYLFNLYDGFSGIYVEKLNDGTYIYHENEHQYKDFPCLTSVVANDINNSTGWINIERINNWNGFYKYISDTKRQKFNGTYINDNAFINNIKYKNIPKIFGDEGVYFIGLHAANASLFNDIENNISRFKESAKVKQITINDSILMLYKDNLVMLIVNNINELTYKSLSLTLHTIGKDKIINDPNLDSNGKTIIDVLYSLFTNLISPEVIAFDAGLNYVVVDGPTKDVKEIEYVKNENEFKYVCRYDGKIKPTFIEDNSNILYFIDYVSNDTTNHKFMSTSYAKYMNSGYEPLYPSIDYFPIKKIDSWNYKKLPMVNTSEGEHSVLNDIEYSWFEDNACLMLVDNLKFIKRHNQSDNYKSIKEILVDCIKEYYNITDENYVNYIVSKYNVSNDYEYVSVDSINDYEHKLTLTLK